MDDRTEILLEVVADRVVEQLTRIADALERAYPPPSEDKAMVLAGQVGVAAQETIKDPATFVTMEDIKAELAFMEKQSAELHKRGVHLATETVKALGYPIKDFKPSERAQLLAALKKLDKLNDDIPF